MEVVRKKLFFFSFGRLFPPNVSVWHCLLISFILFHFILASTGRFIFCQIELDFLSFWGESLWCTISKYNASLEVFPA